MLWKRKLARERKPTPAGFLETCQPVLGVAPPAGPAWLHEMIHDGYRLIARCEGDSARLWSRHASDVTGHFSGIRDAVAGIGINCVLDGEGVMLREDGHSDFEALRNSEASAGAVLVAFDVLEVEGFDFRGQPLERRRAMLSELLALAPSGVVLGHAMQGEGEVMFRHACAMGLEGIVSKRLGSRYEAGRCKDWLKIKNPEFVRR